MYDYTIGVVCPFLERCGVKLKKKRIISKVLLIVLLVVIVLLVNLCMKHWNTITAVVDGMNYSVEEIENIRVDNQKKVDDELSKYPDLNFRNLTSEEITALSKGLISQDDVPYLITGRKVFVDGKVVTSEEYEEMMKDEKDNSSKDQNAENNSLSDNKKDSEGTKKTDNNSSADKNNSDTSKDVSSQSANNQVQPEGPKTNPELEAVLEKFFVLKATFLADIEARVNGMIADYKSIPKKERTKAVRSEYASKAIALMSTMEPQYDAQFEAVVSELSAVIEKIDGDRNLVNVVRDAYKKEKAALKAKYVSRARKHIT